MSAIRNLSDGVETQNNSANNDDDDEVEGAFDFYPNQTSDLYLTVGDAWAVQAAILDALDLDRPDISVNNLSRGDIDFVMQKAEREDWGAQETLWVVTGAIKGWLGTRQRDENEGFGIGLNYGDDGAIEGFYEGGYADAFGDTLPTVDVDGLTNDERKDLKAIGVDDDSLGFHPEKGPQLPFIASERVPVAVETMADVEAVVEQFEALPEAPSLGNTANDVEREDVPAADAGFPVLEGTLDDLEREMNDDECYYTREELQAMREAEAAGKDRTGAYDLIDEALEAFEAADEEDTRSRYAKAEAGDLDESEEMEFPEDANGPAAKAQAVVTLIEAGYDKDEAAEMVYGA